MFAGHSMLCPYYSEGEGPRRKRHSSWLPGVLCVLQQRVLGVP